MNKYAAETFSISAAYRLGTALPPYFEETENSHVHSKMPPGMPAHTVLFVSPRVASSPPDLKEFLPEILFVRFEVSRDLLQPR
jgi:hypothetical protein